MIKHAYFVVKFTFLFSSSAIIALLEHNNQCCDNVTYHYHHHHVPKSVLTTKLFKNSQSFRIFLKIPNIKHPSKFPIFPVEIYRSQNSREFCIPSCDPLITIVSLLMTFVSGEYCPLYRGGGTLNFGLCVMCHQKDLIFFARFHQKTPIFTHFHPMTPIFNKLLVTERPWHIFVTQLETPSFSHLGLIVKQVTIFGKKWIFRTFRQIWRNVEKLFWPFWPWEPLFFDAFHWKKPLFLCALSLKDPLFYAICHRKTPTSEVLVGTRMSLSYVSAPGAYI